MGEILPIDPMSTNKKTELNIILNHIMIEFNNTHHISYLKLWKAFNSLESELNSILPIFQGPRVLPDNNYQEVKNSILTRNEITVKHLTEFMKLFKVNNTSPCTGDQKNAISPNILFNDQYFDIQLNKTFLKINKLADFYIDHFNFILVNFINPMFKLFNNNYEQSDDITNGSKINLIKQRLQEMDLGDQLFFLFKYLDPLLVESLIKKQYFINNGDLIYFSKIGIDSTSKISYNDFIKKVYFLVFSRIIITNLISLRISEMTVKEYEKYIINLNNNI